MADPPAYVWARRDPGGGIAITQGAALCAARGRDVCRETGMRRPNGAVHARRAAPHGPRTSRDRRTIPPAGRPGRQTRRSPLAHCPRTRGVKRVDNKGNGVAEVGE